MTIPNPKRTHAAYPVSKSIFPDSNIAKENSYG